LAFSLAGPGSFPSLHSDTVKVAQNGRCEGRFGARLRARETPAGSESGRVSRLPPPSSVQGAWPSYSPGRAASRGCASTQSKWPAKRPINRRFLPVVMTTLCHTPRWFLDSPQSDSGIHALQLRSVLKPSWQLPESALRRGQSGPKRRGARAVLARTFARPRDARRKRTWLS
jgi:hypothetical protein